LTLSVFPSIKFGHHFGGPDPDPHQNEKPDPDSYQSQQQDPDPNPHQSQNVGATEGRRRSKWMRLGSEWSGGGSVDHWSQILITLMRNRIRIQVESRRKNSDLDQDPQPSEKLGFGSAPHLSDGEHVQYRKLDKTEIAPKNTNSSMRLL
jgi:hypothetical protein